ncbi:hypothetical protein IOD13_11475 [Brevibacterium casei]|nr:hypothetical protein [Brevibacterium casei]
MTLIHGLPRFTARARSSEFTLAHMITAADLCQTVALEHLPASTSTWPPDVPMSPVTPCAPGRANSSTSSKPPTTGPTSPPSAAASTSIPSATAPPACPSPPPLMKSMPPTPA